jgi:hypothetical protein
MEQNIGSDGKIVVFMPTKASGGENTAIFKASEALDGRI